MRVKVKSYAKINLTLNVCGVKDGFHDIESLVTTVDLFDTVTVSPRRDDKILLTMRGLGDDIPQSKNNAYKSAELFAETFKTGGVDIEIFKRIPLAGGLGGSSADVAGVLNAMKKAYEIEDDVKPLADKLGSDTGYMLAGGYALISGRGEVVRPIETAMRLHFVLVYAETGVNTADCYRKFDEIGLSGTISDNEKATLALQNDDFSALCENVGNALTAPAAELNDEVRKNLEAMRSLSPSACGMTGSGSTVFGIFETEELARWAFDKMKKITRECEYVRSLDPQKLKFFGLFGG